MTQSEATPGAPGGPSGSGHSPTAHESRGVSRFLGPAIIASLVISLLLLAAIVYTAFNQGAPGPRTTAERDVIAAEAAAARDPKSVDLRLAAATANLDLGDFDRALAYVHQARELSPGDPAATVLEGDVARARGDLADARTLYETAAATNSAAGVQADLNLAAMDRDEGKIDEAIARLEKILVATPGNALVLVSLGAMEAEIGHTEKARDAFSKALTYVPDLEAAVEGLSGLDYGPAKYDLARVAWLQGDQEAAKALMEQAITLSPDLSWLQVAYGDFYDLLGEHDKAVAAYRRALELDPANQEAKDALAAS